MSIPKIAVGYSESGAPIYVPAEEWRASLGDLENIAEVCSKAVSTSFVHGSGVEYREAHRAAIVALAMLAKARIEGSAAGSG